LWLSRTEKYPGDSCATPHDWTASEISRPEIIENRESGRPVLFYHQATGSCIVGLLKLPKRRTQILQLTIRNGWPLKQTGEALKEAVPRPRFAIPEAGHCR